MLYFVILVIFPLMNGQPAAPGVGDRPSIELYPANHTLFVGDAASFNCTGYRYDHIVWIVNDISVDLLPFKPNTRQDELDKRWVYSQLDIPTHMVNNNSKIFCMGISIFQNFENKPSKDRLLLIQDVPGKVLNFRGVNITDTRLNFSWSPPYHIPGIPPCCHGYSVNITNIDSREVVFDDYITDTFVSFDVQFKYLCSVYEITISAYNKLGEGESMTTKWSLGGYFEASEAALMLSYDKQADLNVGVNVTIDGFCLNDLDNITLSVQCSAVPETILRQTNVVSFPSHVTELMTYISVMIPQTHHDSVCSSQIALENNVDLQGINFVTNDVIDTNITIFPGAVCALCTLLPRSPARGCVLVVSPIGVNRDIETSVNVPKDNGTRCVTNLQQGRYTVRVYDWNKDGGRSTRYVVDRTEDVEQRLDNPDSDDVTDSEKSSSDQNVPLIVGTVVPAVLIVVVGVVIAVIAYFYFRTKHSYNLCKSTEETDGIKMGLGNPGAITLGKPVKVHSRDDLKNLVGEIDPSDSWVYFTGNEYRGYSKYIMFAKAD